MELQQIESVIKNLKYTLIDSYINKNKAIRVIIQDDFGYKYDSSFQHLKSGSIPDFVSIYNPFTLENISQYLKLNKKSFILCEENLYKGDKGVLVFHCNICNNEFSKTWNDIYNKNYGCDVCSGKRTTNENVVAFLRKDLITEWIFQKDGFTPYNTRIYSRKEVLRKCLDCGNEYTARVQDRTFGKSNCPKCAILQNESKLATQLKEYYKNNFNAEIEYKILKNPSTNYWLPFDIYIPHKNIFIEIHGRQHYVFISWFYKTNEEFEYRKYLDKIKKEYAKENGIYIEVDLRNTKEFETAKNIISEYF